nr:MAG TPA: hypothetical protein [Caudoviricetes sp.]
MLRCATLTVVIVTLSLHCGSRYALLTLWYSVT